MYEFIDTIQEASSPNLSAESVCINGVWLEGAVDGFRVLSTTGRESLSASVDSFSVGSSNGGKFKSRRYPEREIIVKYQLITSSAEEFRDAFNQIASILNVEEVRVIFNDEPDKYFVGTPTDFGKVEAGRNAVIGEFTILCLDPFKYDLELSTATGNAEDKLIIDYKGSIPARPVLEVQLYDDGTPGRGNTAFMSFFTEEDHLSIGDPEQGEASTLQFAYDFTKSVPIGAGATQWAVNVEKDTPGIHSDFTGNIGKASHNGTSAMTPTSYGTGSAWHGPTIRRQGDLGEYFTATAVVEFGCMAEKQRRLSFEIKGPILGGSYGDDVSGILAGIRLSKSSTNSTKATVQFIVGNTIRDQSKTVDVNQSGTLIIKKVPNAIQFEAFGIKYTYVYDPPEGYKRGYSTTFCFETYGSDVTDGNSTYMLVKSVNVYSDPSSGYSTGDSFHSGDEFILDTESGYIYYNGEFSPQYGDPSNDWEDFKLVPGMNEIQLAYSDWTPAAYKPRFKIRWRGVYL